MLRGAYDPKIVWLLPEGAPPYKANDLVDQQHRLYAEARKLYLFIEGGNPNLKQLRREALFIELLETVDPDDAKLLLAVKEKHIPYPGVTKEVVAKAFPNIL
jgi:ribosomal protein L7Ae-like RNA K-turn-binding protein